MAGTKMKVNKNGGRTFDWIDEQIVVDAKLLQRAGGLFIKLENRYLPHLGMIDVHYNGQYLASGGGYEEVDEQTIRLDLGTRLDGTPVGLERGDELNIRIWQNKAAGSNTGLDRLRLVKIEEEVLQARQRKDLDEPYSSLDARLDSIQDSIEEVRDSNERIVVFVIPNKVRYGVQKIEIRFPYAGTILDVYASCRMPGNTPSILDIQKIGQAEYEANAEAWESIFSTALTLDANEKSNRTAQRPCVLKQTQVNKNDHFRVVVASAGGGLEDLTVELTIKQSAR